MSFHTPQSAGNKEQQPFSLLFSPSMKAADGQKHSPLGRSSSITPTPFGTTPSFGAPREQSTPPSRRRSLTPASSMAKDTPPPPPVDSLLDSPGLGGPSLHGWATHPQGGDAGGGVEDMSTSPIGGVQQQQQQQTAGILPPHVAAAVAGEYAAAGRALREYESTWVTVFGFAQADVPLILREFGKCGDIVQFGSFDDGPHCNWLHINYSNKHAAQRALLRSGDQLSSSCMVGVKPLDAHKRDAIERQLGGTGAGGVNSAAGGGFVGGQHRSVPAVPKLAGSRPYQVNATSAQAAVVPLPSKSAWEKVSEFILGI